MKLDTNSRSETKFNSLFPWVYSALLGLVAWLLHVHAFPVGDIGVETDFYGELGVTAQKLYAGNFSVLNYPYKGPAYSFFLTALHAITQLFGASWYDSGIILNILCAGAVLVIVHRLILRLRGTIEALTSVILLSLVYEFFFHTHKGSSDLLFFALYLGSIFLLLREDGRHRHLFGSALLAGLAFLTRYNGLILPISTIAVLLTIWPARIEWKHRFTKSLFYLCVFVAVITPWYVANLMETGQLTSTQNLENIFVEEFWVPGQAIGSTGPELPTSLVAVLKANPAGFMGKYLSNIPSHLSDDVLTTLAWPLGVISILGLILIIVKIRDRRLTVFLALEGIYFLAMCLVYHQPRFLFPLLPAYTMGASFFLWNLPLVGLRRAIPVVVLLIVLSGQMQIIVSGEMYYAERAPVWVLDTASALEERISKNTPEEPLLLARKPHLAFYSDMAWVPYPANFGSVTDFLQRARKLGANLIAVSDFELFYHPNKPWMLKLDQANGVKLVHRDLHARIFQLDTTLPVEEFGTDPRITKLLDQLDLAHQIADNEGSAKLAAEIAWLYSENHEYYKAQDYLLVGISAMQDVVKSSSLAPRRAELRLNYANICFQLGDMEKGVSMLEDHWDDFDLPSFPQLMQRAEGLLQQFKKPSQNSPVSERK